MPETRQTQSRTDADEQRPRPLLGDLSVSQVVASALAEGLPAWDEGLTADQLIREGKEMRSHEVLPS